MATVPSQSTVAVNQPITAALWNDDVRDAINFLLSPPQCRAYANTGTSLPNATFTAVALDGEDGDSDAMHSTSTNNSRVTAVTAGLYLLHGQVGHDAVNTTGYRTMAIRLNGSAVIAYSDRAVPAGATIPSFTGTSCLYQLSAGDYVELIAYQSSGGSNPSSAGRAWTFLHALRVSS